MGRRAREEERRQREHDANARSDAEAADTFQRLTREANRRHDERRAAQDRDSED